MSRSNAEWIGKNDDTPVPPHVRLRVLKRFDNICQECTAPITTKRWICDHRIAIINGGANRESNLGPIHESCDKTKTAADVAEKSVVYRKAAKHAGINLRKGPPMQSRRFEPRAPQNRASSPLSKIIPRRSFAAEQQP
jgi:5-methylcytosine-specific restriction endonuclease McrA